MKTKTPTVVNNLPSTTKMHWQMTLSAKETSELKADSLNFLVTSMGLTKEKAKEMLGLV